MPSNRRTAFLVSVFVAAACLAGRLSGDDFFWDADPLTDGNQNGGGVWTSGGPPFFWTDTALLFDSLSLPWVNGATSVAHFGAPAGYTNPGQGGIVTLGETIALNRLVVGSQGGAYVIAPGTGGHLLQFDGADPELRIDSVSTLRIEAGIASAGTLLKTGTGRVVLAAPAGLTSLGGLRIQEGTIALAEAGTLPASLGVVVGDGANAGRLEILADQTLAGLRFESRSAAVTNEVAIAAGTTLTVNGATITGIVDGSATGGTTRAVFSGEGALVVDHATGSFIVSSGEKPSGGNDTAFLDLSGLASFAATVNRFDVGRSTNATGAFQNSGRPVGTLLLAGSNLITADSLVVGMNLQVTTDNLLILGQENTIHANTVVGGGGRARGTIEFAAGLDQPTLVLRGQGGGSTRANLTLADSRNVTGTGGTGGSSTPVGAIDLSGGTVDLLIGTLNIGYGGTDNGGFAGGAYGRGEGYFTFGGEGSVVDVNRLHIGLAASSSLVAENSPDPVLTGIGVFTMHGGALTVNEAFVLARSLDNADGNQQSVNGAFHLNGGQAIVNAPIQLGEHTSTGSGILSGTLNLNGGSLSVSGAITRGSAFTVGNLNLHGASLDLQGHAIGDATNPISLSWQSGRLANVAEINGGADFVKSGAGTLVLDGTSAFTGAIRVEEGRLLVASTSALQNAASVAVEGGAAFDFATGSGGTLTLPTASGVALDLADGASLGAELGSATGSIVVQAGSSVATDVAAAIGVNLYRLGAAAPPASSILLSAPGGGITANGATYNLGTVYNATDFTASLNVSDTEIEVLASAATALSAAYWLGGFGPAPGVWAASNGIDASNWVTNADGTGATGLVPGAAADVFFSATGATLPALTELGADMSFNRLTIDTADPLMVEASGHRLTLLGAAPLTVNAGAGAVVFGADLELGAVGSATLAIDNAGGFTLEGVLSAPLATHLVKTGNGTLTLSQPSLHSARTSVLGGTLAIGSQAALGANPAAFAADHLTLDGGTLRATTGFRLDDANRGITLGAGGGAFEVAAGVTLGIDQAIAGSGGLTKTGDGALEIASPSGYSGGTSIQGGTLVAAGGDNTLPTGTLNFAAASATLALGSNAQSVSALTFTAPGSASLARVTGNGGSLAANNSSGITEIATTVQTNPLTFDLSRLSSFAVNGGSQNLRIGLGAGSHTAGGAVPVVTVILAESNLLAGGSLLIGDQVGSSGGGLTTILLGQENVLNYNSITQAAARSSGVIRFAEGLVDPTATIRAQNGASALGTWNMGGLDNFTNNVWTSTADFRGGALDALVTTLNVGRVINRNGTMNADFLMDRGVLTVTNLNVGVASGTNTGAPTSVRVANSTFVLAGPGAVNVTNLVLANNTSNAGTGTSTANGTLTVRDGALNVGGGGIQMGRATNAGHVSNAVLEIFGGMVSVAGDIFRFATGDGTAEATILLSGGTLDLGGNAIGTVARPIQNLIFERGILRNVSEINGGGDWTKSGGGTLTLEGINTFSGGIDVTGGILAFSAADQLGDASVSNSLALEGGTLSYTGLGAASLDTNQSISLSGPGGTVEIVSAAGSLELPGGISAVAAADLEKTGAGAFFVSGGIDLAGGQLTVSEGLLAAGLAANGIGGIDVAADATLHLTDGGVVTVNLADLTLADGSALGFELGAPGSNDALAVSGTALVGGSVTLDFFNLGGMDFGAYDLITAAGGLDAATYLVGAAPLGFNLAITASGTLVRLTASDLIRRYWSGAIDGSWSTLNAGATNWAINADGTVDPGVLPGSADTVVFSADSAPLAGGAIHTTLDGTFVLDSLRFLAAPAGVQVVTVAPGSGGTLAIAPLTATNGILVDDNAGAVSIAAPLTADAPQTWHVAGAGANGSSLTLSGDIVLNSAVTKTGAGVLALDGNRSGAGALNVTEGRLDYGSAAAGGGGATSFASGAAFDNSSGAPLILDAGGAMTWTGDQIFVGSHDLDLGPRDLALGGNVALTVAASTLTVSGAIGDGGGGHLLYKDGPGALVLSGDNSHGGGATLASGALGIGSATALGTGVFTIGDGTVLRNAAGAPLALSTNNLMVWEGDFTFEGPHNLDLGSGQATIQADAAVTVANSRLSVGGGLSDGGLGYGLVKDGAGELALGGQSQYGGNTLVKEGVLLLLGDEALPAGTTVRLGEGSAAGTLDLGGFSQTVGGFTVDSTTNAVTNQLIVSPGETLTVNGGVVIGGVGANTTTRFVASGGGDLVVNSGGANFQVGGLTTGATRNAAEADLSDLASFTANLGGGVLRVGETGGPTSGAPTSTLRLAENNHIVASAIRVGDATSPESPNNPHTLVLGSGTNLLHANNLVVGSGSGGGAVRSSGRLVFDPGDSTGSVVVRGSDGVGAAAIHMVHTIGNTNARMVSEIDFSGHHADVLASSLTMAKRFGASGSEFQLGNSEATFSFDEGVLDIGVVEMAIHRDTKRATATATLNLGDSGKGAAVSIGQLTMAENTSEGGSATATVNVTGGDVTFTGPVLLANAGAGRTATGSLHLTGGAVTLGSHDILRSGGDGTENASILLDGAHLDMNGRSIGSAAAPVTLEARSGTLSNLGELNGGGDLAKIGGGELILDGVHTYSGDTLVQVGTLLVNGDASGATGNVTVSSGATLGGSGGSLGGTTSSATVLADGTLTGGTAGGVGTLSFGGDLTMATNSAWLVDLVQDVNGLSDRIQVVGALNIASGATLDLGTFSGNWTFNNTYTIATFASLTGTFADLDDGDIFTHGAGGYRIEYGAGAITLTAVPEPAALLPLAMLLIAGLLPRRRRRMGGDLE